MKLGDLTELAARNLREAVLRNSLTTLGIAVGVASLVALLSLGVGLQQLVDRSVARAGLFDTISVRSRQSTPFGQPGGGRRTRATPRIWHSAAAARRRGAQGNRRAAQCSGSESGGAIYGRGAARTDQPARDGGGNGGILAIERNARRHERTFLFRPGRRGSDRARRSGQAPAR